MHVIPQLRELENRFREEIFVVGVHSAKYTAEGDDRHLRAAVQRLNLTNPVVNDREMRIWSEYGVRAWPSLMFVSPDGRVIGKHEGEFQLEAMVQVVEEMLEEFDTSDSPVDSATELTDETTLNTGVLAFPTAIQVDATRNRLIIADTNHNRIIVVRFDGSVTTLIGSGAAGMKDGPLESASFHRPHGLALHDNLLYVADTENHAIRLVDLETGEVSTIAGTGLAAESYLSGGPARTTPLRSPWDVTVMDDILYIAMAGNHQLWVHALGSDEIRRFAGTGHEGKRDGAIRSAWLAQPSGIESFGNQLVFADAETSSVRTSDLVGSDGNVTTVVGKDLFDWGDQVGLAEQALLQHVTGVTGDAEQSVIYVADTYNNKIKRIDMKAGLVEHLAGNGLPELADGSASEASFFEPHGLAISGNTLYVADTNNHAIRRIALESGDVSTLQLYVT